MYRTDAKAVGGHQQIGRRYAAPRDYLRRRKWYGAVPPATIGL
jgi:hypothetical protein